MAAAGDAPIVVVLHGIGQTRWNMLGIARALKKAGFEPRLFGYPSLRHDTGTLAKCLSAYLERTDVWSGGRPVHFVTHSMGGLVLRDYLVSTAPPADWEGRAVMIGPPHRGSEVADLMARLKPYHWFYGPAGLQLTTAWQDANPVRCGFSIGIIAGDAGWLYPVARFLFDGPHDGRVAVERTRLDGMADHIVLPVSHAMLPWRRDVHRQIVAFLRTGSFER